jgi:hypothetical protein
MSRRNYFVQTIPCPKCKKNILIEIHPWFTDDECTLRITADCLCGFSSQKTFEKPQPWTPGAIVNQLIHTSKQLATGIDESHLTFYIPKCKPSSVSKSSAPNTVNNQPKTPLKRTKNPPEMTPPPVADTPAP